MLMKKKNQLKLLSNISI